LFADAGSGVFETQQQAHPLGERELVTQRSLNLGGDVHAVGGVSSAKFAEHIANN
jgi:hypothetical protein